jgi:hypothetical protein
MKKNRGKERQERRRRERRAKKMARKQRERLEKPLPGLLFSLEELCKADSASYLKAVFQALPEETILGGLPPAQGEWSRRGRRAFPRRAMLRALVARQAYRIPSYAALAERLSSARGGLLKYECGFDMSRPSPSPDALEDFAQLLGRHCQTLRTAHAQSVRALENVLPGLGEETSWDSTHLPIIPPAQEDDAASDAREACDGGVGQAATAGAPVQAETAARTGSTAPAPAGLFPTQPEGVSEDARPATPAGKRSRRRKRRGYARPAGASNQDSAQSGTPPLEADWGMKTYETVEDKKIQLPNGSAVDGIQVKQTKVKLFGGKMHVIVDNRYKLPLLVQVTPQSQGDCPMIVPMYRELCKTHPSMEVRCAMIDKAGDSEEVHRVLAGELEIIPFIPLRDVPNPEAPADPSHEFPKTVYDRERKTHILDPRTGRYEECHFWGYDHGRQALKYRCPCSRMRQQGRLAPKALCPFLGAKCGASRGETPYSFWIPLKENWRYYCAVPRESKRWAESYKRRTTVERLNPPQAEPKAR